MMNKSEVLTGNKKKFSLIAGGLFFGAVIVLGLSVKVLRENDAALRYCKQNALVHDTKISCEAHAVELPAPTPWNCIGGCGASGSGSTGDGIQWIGNGVQGGLVDVEVMSRYTLRKNFKQTSFTPRFSFKPTWTTGAGISFPVFSKTGAVQYLANQEELDRTTGGIGDLTVDFSKSIGYSGTYQMQVSLTLPTGQYDIKRGPENNLKFLPVDFQMGSGIYSGSLQISRLIDVENGLFKVDASYSHPFMARPLLKKNEMLDEYYKDYRNRRSNDRFYYRAKPYGESDLGAYTPPSLSLAGYFAYRGEPGYVHSCGLSLSAPLGIAWIPEPSVSTYAPIKDPGHKAWSGALIYAIEFSKPKYPLLLAISLPVHDKPDIYGKIDGPDFSDFLNQWVFAVGIKSTLF